MDKIWKEKWLKALRSGEYKQGQGALKRNNTFCCLGVLCDIYAKEKGLVFTTSRVSDKEEILDHVNSLPSQISEDTGVLKGKDTSVLMDMNDDGKESFSEIADYIEKNL